MALSSDDFNKVAVTSESLERTMKDLVAILQRQTGGVPGLPAGTPVSTLGTSTTAQGGFAQQFYQGGPAFGGSGGGGGNGGGGSPGAGAGMDLGSIKSILSAVPGGSALAGGPVGIASAAVGFGIGQIERVAKQGDNYTKSYVDALHGGGAFTTKAEKEERAALAARRSNIDDVEANANSFISRVDQWAHGTRHKTLEGIAASRERVEKDQETGADVARQAREQLFSRFGRMLSSPYGQTDAGQHVLEQRYKFLFEQNTRRTAAMKRFIDNQDAAHASSGVAEK